MKYPDWICRIIHSPTKEERNKIYKLTLKQVENEGWWYLGFCYQLSRKSKEYDTYGFWMKKNFPEIYKYKPKKFKEDDYWFECFGKKDEKRESILKQAIEETN